MTLIQSAIAEAPSLPKPAFYILSLAHTGNKDRYLTLWAPNNAGYSFCQEYAGIYESPSPGYHDNEDNMPIPTSVLDPLFILLPYDHDRKLHMIPNCRAIWEYLGLKPGKDNLKRVKKPS